MFPISFPSKPGEHCTWSQLHGAGISLAISLASQTSKNPLVIFTPDMAQATRLAHELQFFINDSKFPILTLPDWEMLPYDHFSAHQDIISQRLLTLYRLPTLKQGILIVPVSTLMHRLAPREYLETHSFILAQGDELDMQALRLRLETNGYHYVNQVMEHGEFSIRGSILDLFPMGSHIPYRIDLFDNEVDSIRTFDPETQRTIEKITNIQLLPAREFPLTETAINRFRQKWRDLFSGNPLNSPIYVNISEGESAPGIEYYLPLFFEHTNTLFDYLPKNSVFISITELNSKAEEFWSEITGRYEQLRYDITRPLLTPETLFLTANEIFAAMKQFPQIKISNESTVSTEQVKFPTQPLPELTFQAKSTQPFTNLQSYLNNTDSRILFCAETAGRREALLALFKTISLFPKQFDNWQDFLNDTTKIGITVASLEEGVYWQNPSISIIAEAQLFGQQVMQRRLRKSRHQDPNALFRDLTELNVGAPVVHIDHGIGLYLGLQTITTNDIETEYLTLEYAGGAKLYVPVASLHLISRYTGTNSENIPLHHLGTKQWERTKRKAAEQIRDVAAELLDIYAKRAAKQGHTYSKPSADYQRFASAFPFEETPDQQAAIEQVINDLSSPKIMDRLVCGDVGFGKTEVAMRAAFVAIQDNKQVAVLVPTTVLAEQHAENFKDRFADWPVKIAALSRFRSAKEQKNILEELKQGKIDIIIGTHKLLQPGIQFKDLGLLIVDEEHRFGVRDKDRIKALRNQVDILTLTATPIPRTLNMAMAAIRDLSIIATPPAKRLAIKTFIRPYEKSIIREAILRENLRGGQVYFLHNEVQSIERMSRELQTLIPEARIGIAHGQMRELELEKVMTDFYHLKFNVLLCTTIIESGIDVPTANTIIINRADRLGLAQLHQLRGRVGRSHHQAYAFLLIPDENTITSDAQRRLEALASMEELGAGFMLATHDLEIRGAGELLGEEQSGQIQTIGFSLYMELLEQTVKALQSGKEPTLDLALHHGPEIDLKIPALIPESYLPDIHMRLNFYKRIANAENITASDELQVEMIDRFGLIPPSLKNLFRITELKMKANPLGIQKIEVAGKIGRILFGKESHINVNALIDLIQKKPQQYQLQGQDKLRFHLPDEAIETKMKLINELLDKLR